MQFSGMVIRKRINPGSKSEHDAVVLVTDAGELKLRRQGGNPFADPELERLVGQRIHCDGLARAGQLIVTRYEIVR
jgi:hypothetical protein